MEQIRMMRLFRLKHGISLTELGAAVNVSRQYITEIELALQGHTTGNEALMRRAFEAVIADRQARAAALTADYVRCKDHLFDITTHESEDTI